MAARILIVDDDHQLVRLLSTYLEQSGFQVLSAYDGTTALRDIRRERPDLVLLDVMLPDHDGWEITRIVRGDASLAGTAIIMLTARVEDADKVVGLELGADDYITKPFNPREVVARVRAVLRRGSGSPVPERILVVDGLQLDPERHVVLRDGQTIDLRPTEFALLKALMEHPGRTFTRLNLIEKAFGYGYEGLERTIDSHIKNLRRRIEPDPAVPTYVQTVFGVGYRLRSED